MFGTFILLLDVKRMIDESDYPWEFNKMLEPHLIAKNHGIGHCVV